MHSSLSRLLLAASIAAYCPTAHSTTDLDSLTQAVRQGVSLSQPVSLRFEWKRPTEGSNAQEILNALARAGFSTRSTTIRGTASRPPEFVTEGTWHGVVDKPVIDSLINELDALVAAQGRTHWTISQTRP